MDLNGIKDPIDFDVIDEFANEISDEDYDDDSDQSQLDPQTGILYNESGTVVNAGLTPPPSPIRTEVGSEGDQAPRTPSPQDPPQCKKPMSLRRHFFFVKSDKNRSEPQDLGGDRCNEPEFLVLYNVDILKEGQSLILDTDMFKGLSSETVVILTQTGHFYMCNVSQEDLMSAINQRNLIIQSITQRDFYKKFQFVVRQ